MGQYRPVIEGKNLLNVWALDPGGTTGFVSVLVPCMVSLDPSSEGRTIPSRHGTTAYVRIEKDPVELIQKAKELGWFFGGELDHPEWQEHVMTIGRAIVDSETWARNTTKNLKGYVGARLHLVMEGFTQSSEAMTGDAFGPVRIASGFDIMQWSGELGLDFYGEQLPAAKAQMRDDRLKLWDLYEPGKPHQNDAMRHLLIHLRKLAA